MADSGWARRPQSSTAHHRSAMRRDRASASGPARAPPINIRAFPTTIFVLSSFLLFAPTTCNSKSLYAVCELPGFKRECESWPLNSKSAIENIRQRNDYCEIGDLYKFTEDGTHVLVSLHSDGSKMVLCKIRTKPGNSIRTRRQTGYPLRGRYRGQTQSQYLAIDRGNGKDEGKAEAHSAADSSRAIVFGNSGMGQAQSQTVYDPSCEDCNGRSDQNGRGYYGPDQNINYAGQNAPGKKLVTNNYPQDRYSHQQPNGGDYNPNYTSGMGSSKDTDAIPPNPSMVPQNIVSHPGLTGNYPNGNGATIDQQYSRNGHHLPPNNIYLPSTGQTSSGLPINRGGLLPGQSLTSQNEPTQGGGSQVPGGGPYIQGGGPRVGYQVPGGGQSGQGGTFPGQGGIIPGQSGILPGQGGNIPGQGGILPGQGGNIPSQGSNFPGHGGNLPGSRGILPGQSGNIPGQGGNLPGQGGNIPGQGTSFPGQGGNIPGQGTTYPGRGGNIPGQGTTYPGQGGNIPGQGGSVLGPGQSGNLPGQGGYLPDQRGVLPNQGGNLPGQAGSQPGQGGTTQGGTLPSQGGVYPNLSGSLPGLGNISPGQSGSRGNSDSVPQTLGRMPSDQSGVPFNQGGSTNYPSTGGSTNLPGPINQGNIGWPIISDLLREKGVVCCFVPGGQNGIVSGNSIFNRQPTTSGTSGEGGLGSTGKTNGPYPESGPNNLLYPGQITGQYPGPTQTTGQYPGSGQNTGQYPGSGQTTGQYPGSGQVTGQYPGSGQATGQYPGSGQTTGQYPGSGQTTGQYPGSGQTTGQYPGSGQTTGQYPGSGQTTGQYPGSGQTTGQYPVSGQTNGQYPGSGQTTSQYPGTGQTTGQYPGSGQTTGQYPGSSQTTGQYPGSGQTTGQYPGPGQTSGQYPGAGQTTGQYPGSGQTTGQYPGLGQTIGQYPGSGQTSGQYPGSGQTTGQYPGSPQTTGQYPGAGQTNGQYPGSGQTTGQYPGSGQTTGQYPGSGQTTGQYPGSGHTTGQYPGLGQTTGQYPGSGQTTGQYPGSGQTTAQYPGSGQTAGQYPGSGQTTGQYPGSGQVTGQYPGSGQATGQYPGSGQTTGQYPGSGQTTGQYPGSGQTAGQYPGSGQTAGQYPGSGQTNGQYPGSGQTTGQYPGSGQTNGQYPGSGQTNGQYPGSGHTNGQYPGTGTNNGQYPETGQNNYVTGGPGQGSHHKFDDQGNPIYGNDYGGVPQNVLDPNSISSTLDDYDSEAQASVSQAVNGTTALASSKGGNDKGRAQTQVEGTYTGTGSFSANAEISDDNKAAQSHVSGSEKGASSGAEGSGRKNKSQASVKLGSETGSIITDSQSSGDMHTSSSQVQGSVKGGMADAQAKGPGSTSSQAQIGFTPFKEEDKEKHDLFKTPFEGSGTSSAQSSRRMGTSQSQLRGTFKYGISYNGAAQAGSSLDKDAEFLNLLPFNKIDVFDENNKNINVDITSTNKPADATVSWTEYSDEITTEKSTKTGTEDIENEMSEHAHSDHHIIDQTTPRPQSKQSATYAPITNTGTGSLPTGLPPVVNSPAGSLPAGTRRSFHNDNYGSTTTTTTNGADYDYPTDKEIAEEYEIDDGFGAEGTDNAPVEPVEYPNYDDVTRDTETHQSLQNPNKKSYEIRQTTGGNTQHIILGSLNNHDAKIIQRNSEHPDEKRVYQPGERVPGMGGYTIPAGFTGSVKSVASKENTYVVGSKYSPSQAQTVKITPGTGKVKYVYPHNYGQNINPKDLRSLRNSKPDDNRYVSVSKSVTRDLDNENNIRKQYSHTYYTKSSSCGYFTFTCTMVSSAQGKKKVCTPKAPMRC